VLNIGHGAQVQITGKNFEPDRGLFYGAERECSLNSKRKKCKSRGRCIPAYRGLAWMPIIHRPWVVITSIEIKCRRHCCSFKFIPLSLAYAKTGHTFQGENVGLNHTIARITVHLGKNMFSLPCCICLHQDQPLLKHQEIAQNLDYFFCSNDMNRDRISNLTSKKKGQECIKIKNRKNR
jgi:hypothetical protein